MGGFTLVIWLDSTNSSSASVGVGRIQVGVHGCGRLEPPLHRHQAPRAVGSPTCSLELPRGRLDGGGALPIDCLRLTPTNAAANHTSAVAIT